MIVLLGACDTGGGLRITAEADEPHFRRGLQMARSGQNQIALEAFLKVIEKRGGDAPESHFEAGQIYLNHIRDPIAAIYHYRKYLELRPNSPQAPQVWQLIDTGKKQFAATLAAEPLGQQFERLDLLDALEKLKAENTSLRSEISKLGKQPPSPMSITQSRPAAAGSPSEGSFNDPFANAAVQPVVPIETPAMEQRAEPQRPANSAADRPGGRTYTVLAKDTLYGISVKFYGSGNRWQSIMQANSDVLRSSADLKPGMVLRIP
ncbi:MAG: Cell division protein CpoB [Opitutaceae bacterium]